MRRILVVATRQIGDVLLTTPLIRAARELWPTAEIDVLGLVGTLAMLRGNPDVHATIEIERGRGVGTLVSQLRRLWRRYDLALVTQPSDRAHLFGFVAASRRSGIVPAERRHAWWKRLLLRHAVESAGDRGTLHSADEKLALLAPWRAGVPTSAGGQVVPPAAGALPESIAPLLSTGYVVVHAPSMWRYKQWPLAHYGEVVRWLLAAGRQVVLTGGPSDADRAQAAELAALGRSPALIDAAGQLDWNQMTALFAGAALYVGPDTSATHLAAAAGVPVVTVFGPTNPLRWAPLGGLDPNATVPALAAARPDSNKTAPALPFARYSEAAQRRGRVILLQGPGACVPCGRAGCEDRHDSHSACLEAITAERVIDAVRGVLAPGLAAATAN